MRTKKLPKSNPVQNYYKKGEEGKGCKPTTTLNFKMSVIYFLCQCKYNFTIISNYTQVIMIIF